MEISSKTRELESRGYQVDQEIMQLYKYVSWIAEDLPVYVYRAEITPFSHSMVPVKLLTPEGIVLDRKGKREIFRMGGNILLRVIGDIPPPPNNEKEFEVWNKFQEYFIVSGFFA